MKIDDKIIELNSPPKAPAVFKIMIESKGNKFQHYHNFNISGAGSDTGNIIKSSYEVDGKDHSSYLDFFQKLAVKYGIRVPHNRKTDRAQPSFSLDYRVVLTENLHSKMHYGYGDPAVLKVNMEGEPVYYLVCTSNDAPDSFPIIKSKNLKDWEFCSYVFPADSKPDWTAEGESLADYWAPEMHQVGAEFRVYFVARDKYTRELCLGLARASHPEGPFSTEPEPIIKGNVIDPHLFVEDEKNVYLFWKEDNNDIWPHKLTELLFHHPYLISHLFPADSDRRTATLITSLWPWAKNLAAMERFFVLQIMIEAVIERFTEFENLLSSLCKKFPRLEDSIEEILRFMRTPMFVQKLADDGKTLMDEKVKILENDMQWEAHLIEGMWVTRHENKYYLFYAGNDFSTDQYGIGVAISEQLTGPYIKSQKQLLQSSKEWAAPGHPSVLRTEEGTYLMFLHAYSPGNAGYKKFRALLEIQLELNPEEVTIIHS